MGDALAPWHIILLVVVILVLFGSRRLPGAAKSLGESMHIFKKSVQGLNPEDEPTDVTTSSATLQQTALPVSPQLTPGQPAFDATQQAQAQQLADLQRQLSELQRQNGGGSATVGGASGPMSEAQHGQQPV